jgi:hypothetical protein
MLRLLSDQNFNKDIVLEFDQWSRLPNGLSIVCGIQSENASRLATIPIAS